MLALLPPVLTARENAALPGRRLPHCCRASSLADLRQIDAHSARRRSLAGSIAAQPALTLTPELSVKLHPTLLKQWLNGSSEQLPVLIQLRAQADLNRSAIAAAPSAAERRAALVNELQTTADRSQAGVLALLDEAQQADRASEIRSLWINNSIAAHIDRDVLPQIAARDDVAFIQPDRYRQWIDTSISIEPPTSNLQLPLEWHIQRIRADQVWSALNVSGTGVVVANMDTGVDWQHPALSGSYRGGESQGTAQSSLQLVRCHE